MKELVEQQHVYIAQPPLFSTVVGKEKIYLKDDAAKTVFLNEKPEHKKEFQRLKDDENDRLKLGWNLQRTLAKINYRIHTDAVRETLIPPAVTKQQAALVYANEADLLNVALFGQTAKQWRDSHPGADGNVRDHAPLEQLVVLTNLESLNSVLIR